MINDKQAMKILCKIRPNIHTDQAWWLMFLFELSNFIDTVKNFLSKTLRSTFFISQIVYC